MDDISEMDHQQTDNGASVVRKATPHQGHRIKDTLNTFESMNSLSPPGITPPVNESPRTLDTNPPVLHPHSFHSPPNITQQRQAAGGVLPLSLNQLAILAASQNKLPSSQIKGIVRRVGRHTQSSAKKLGPWYKNDNYVDKNSYSWRNMELFADYQKQFYTPDGAIKSTCKK